MLPGGLCPDPELSGDWDQLRLLVPLPGRAVRDMCLCDLPDAEHHAADSEVYLEDCRGGV